MTQTTNKAGLELLKKFEGCELTAYKLDGEKHFTIGYGHSFDDSINADTVWTQEQAEAQLKKDLHKYESYVVKYADEYKFTLNDNQFAALVSYCYNRGPGGLKQLLSNSKNVDEMADNIVVYWGSAEKYKKGLVRRREAEKELFLKPVVVSKPKEQPKPAPKPVVKPKVTHKPAKSISQLADEVMKGLHGSGRERMLSLGANYAKVQQEVNRRMR